MRKIIFFTISFLFIFNSIASACNFRISNFGDPKENVKIEPIAPVLMPDQFGGEKGKKLKYKGFALSLFRYA